MAKNTPQQKLDEIASWANKSLSFLSSVADYSKGYKEGMEQAQRLIKEILNS